MGAMGVERVRAVWRDWPHRRRLRARRARDLQLEFQQDKARRIVGTIDEMTAHRQARADEVRRQIEAVKPLGPDARVLEVGCGAHGNIFFQGFRHAVGIDPLSHHLAALFPQWQRRARTAAAEGEALPFADASFDVVISDNVIDHAERPAAIIHEIERVLRPDGIFFFEVHISHRSYGVFSWLHGIWVALGIGPEVTDFAQHTAHLSLEDARRLFAGGPLRIVWERENIAATRDAMARRRIRRFRAWVQSTFYRSASYEAVAVRDRSARRQVSR